MSQEMFTYHGIFSDYPNCNFVVRRYGSPKNIYIGIVSRDEGPICHCTINTQCELPDDRIAVKDYSENEGMVERLKELDIITGDPVEYISSGFVDIGVYMLSEKGKKLVQESLS